ncbi:isochorismate synthase [Massilia violaceinigra]|uniref:isochorismate synthase n=1 Tax=Massilia violaceinigra TaxID=2045208 RepID=A0ABY4A0B5_9BURK|nr:isochorismate synthase [Massilia violaceinigra]UOD28191.1 isochorismate synthase [Massilia violaceinigra]
MNDRLHGHYLSRTSAADLCAHYEAGATLFSSPGHTLLASGKRSILAPQSGAALADAAASLLRAARRDGEALPVMIGAVPFLADAPAHLFIPEHVLIATGPANLPAATPQAPAARARFPRTIAAVPNQDQYRSAVARAVERIRAGQLEKVVLSRSLTLETEIDVAALLARLGARNAHGYTFAIDLAPDHDGRRTLIGASPELLLSRTGARVRCHPLAGSIPRSADPHEDQRRAQGLLASQKDLHEHALVADMVADSLRPYCHSVSVPAVPSLIATPTMWHLGSEVTAELNEPGMTSLALAMALHPTPAVCGHPAADARSFISEAEGFDRGYFAGLVGWMDANGDGEWAVTLRCADVRAHSATLYAGAGIVAGSDPELEYLETSGKLRTMLRAMGLEAVLEEAA